MKLNLVEDLISKKLDPEFIVASLAKSSKGIGQRLQQMIMGGFGAGEILSYFQRNPKEVKLHPNNFKPATPEDIAKLAIIKGKLSPVKNREESSLENLKGITEKAVDVGAGAAGLGLLGRGVGAAVNALGGSALDSGQPEQLGQSVPPVAAQPQSAGVQTEAQGLSTPPGNPVAEMTGQSTALTPISDNQQFVRDAINNKSLMLYDPQLDEFIRAGLQKGHSVEKLANKAQKLHAKQFGKTIKMIEKDFGKPFRRVLSEIFGSNSNDKQGFREKLLSEFSKNQGGQRAQQPQSAGTNNMDAEILAEIQAFKKLLGG